MSAFRAALVALSAVVLTAACAAGQDAQTGNEKTTLDGTQGTVGSISLEGVALQAPMSGPAYTSGTDVPLSVYIANNGTTADTLTKISSPSFPGGFEVMPPSAGGEKIGAGSAVGFSQQNLGTSDEASQSTILLRNLTSDLYPGMAVKVTFTFAKAGQTTLTVPVQLNNAPEGQTVPPLPTSSA